MILIDKLLLEVGCCTFLNRVVGIILSYPKYLAVVSSQHRLGDVFTRRHQCADFASTLFSELPCKMGSFFMELLEFFKLDLSWDVELFFWFKSSVDLRLGLCVEALSKYILLSCGDFILMESDFIMFWIGGNRAFILIEILPVVVFLIQNVFNLIYFFFWGYLFKFTFWLIRFHLIFLYNTLFLILNKFFFLWFFFLNL